MSTTSLSSSLPGLPSGFFQSFPSRSTQLVGLLTTAYSNYPDSQDVPMLSASSAVSDLVHSSASKERCTTDKPDGINVANGSLQQIHPGSSVILGASRSFATENVQAASLQYHSAPSSMLASLVDVGEEFFPHVSSPLSQGSETEFARSLGDAFPAASTRSIRMLQVDKSETSRAFNAMEAEQRLTEHTGRTRLVSQQCRSKRTAGIGIVEDVNRIPLSAIFEHGPELPSENFGSSQISIICKQQEAQTAHTVGVGNLVADTTSGNSFMSPASCNPLPALPHTKTNLIRHSSSPAGLLSRLVPEAQCQSVRHIHYLSGPLMQAPAECLPGTASKEKYFSPASGFNLINSFGSTATAVDSKDDINRLKLPTTSNKDGLLRQSSSPAGLISQLSFEGIAENGGKFMSTSSSGNSSEEGGYDRRGGTAYFPGFPFLNWDDARSVMGAMQNNSACPTRKRVRESDAKILSGLTLPDCPQIEVLEQGSSVANHFGLPSATSPESQMTVDKVPPDFLPCQTRAKRGCATHPRSIAERVRRTKISERMRKLQELVPNMDKQTNTADMLDEAVEYIKSLQHQVQEPYPIACHYMVEKVYLEMERKLHTELNLDIT